MLCNDRIAIGNAEGGSVSIITEPLELDAPFGPGLQWSPDGELLA
jgi:hypothetical protein